MQKKKSARWNGEFSTVQEQQDTKRRLLLREAGRAFSEKGFHNTTLDEVATRLGISKTIFYHYFGNKNDVLKACVEIGFEIATRALEQVTERGGNGLDKVVEFVRLYTEGITSELGACAVILEIRSLAADDYKTFNEAQKYFDGKLRAFIQEGLDDGSIDVPDVNVAVNWIMGAPSVMARWYRSGGRLTAHDVASQYAEFTKRSLEKRSST